MAPAPPKSGMAHIPAESLKDLPSRLDYLKSFISFTSDDAAALRAAAPVVGPLVPAVVDAVYTKLFCFDITAQSFVPRQSGYTGEAPAKVSDLSHDHPMIRFRKDFLSGYLKKLVTMDYKKFESWEYMDKVGLMHTGKAGFSHRVNKPALRVEYMHCALLLGYVEDILINTVITHPDLDVDTKNAVARAVNKVLWIQNDLFARHYIAEAAEEAAVPGIALSRTSAATLATGLVAVGAGLMHYLS